MNLMNINPPAMNVDEVLKKEKDEEREIFMYSLVSKRPSCLVPTKEVISVGIENIKFVYALTVIGSGTGYSCSMGYEPADKSIPLPPYFNEQHFKTKKEVIEYVNIPFYLFTDIEVSIFYFHQVATLKGALEAYTQWLITEQMNEV